MNSLPIEPVHGPRHHFMEHRWGQRVACRQLVQMYAGAGSRHAGRLRNVSMSGAFIETESELPVFARIELTVLPTAPEDREVTVMASVVRSDIDGIGVEWCDMPIGSVCAMLGCTARCAAATPICLVPQSADHAAS